MDHCAGHDGAAYTIQVERVTMTGSDPNRNLLIRVTDKRLLDATGGVVQGMSGSPIVQNGRLAAVLTHVLVNDPSRGYAIFATTMLEKADAVASSKMSAEKWGRSGRKKAGTADRQQKLRKRIKMMLIRVLFCR